MISVVTGLLMLAGWVVREQGPAVDDVAWRAEAAGSQQHVVSETDGDVRVVAGPPVGTVDGNRSDWVMDDTEMSAVAPGDWDVACERKQGSHLVFDRASVRELGRATLFRWSAPSGSMPDSEDAIYTAVADCRQMSIEPTWPGKRTPTRAGTCGRHLVEAVCASRMHTQR
jgi:hypothetical protein